MYSAVCENISSLIMHMYGSEVLEYFYTEAKEHEKRKLLFAFYGKYFIIL